MAGDKSRKPPGDDLLDWWTVSYRTLYLIVGSVLAIGGAIGAYYWAKYSDPNVPVARAPPHVASVRFTSIEGSVKVKQVGTFEWITADRDILLRRGDLVKT